MTCAIAPRFAIRAIGRQRATAGGSQPCGAWRVVSLGVALVACSSANRASGLDARPVTTAGAIAVANLDHQIAQRRDDAEVAELLLLRSRFLGDYAALDRASTLAEARFETARDLLRRAQTRAAVHRFADALTDLTAAERAGVDGDESVALRASILVATGRAAEVIPQLEARAAGRPGFAAHAALAGAYAAAGRLAEADRSYAAALAGLDTTSPFPYAWVYFARGEMWAERGGDAVRGAAMYARALAHLPAFVTANLHLAELEAERGDLAAAVARLERIVASTPEPEALSLLGQLHVQIGDAARGEREISVARRRYDALLQRHPLAFADHAAQFYLGPGADPERAWALAQQNLAGRRTERAIALAVEAAHATGRLREARALEADLGLR